MTIDECIKRIDGFVDRVADRGVEIMKEEVPVGRTGALKASVNKESTGQYSRSVGSSNDHAGYVQYGRGAVTPKTAKALAWTEYSGTQTSIHHGTPGAFVFSKYSSPAPPNDFCGRTANKLRGEVKSLW